MLNTVLTNSESRQVVRRSPTERMALLEARKKEIAAQLAALSARQREADRKRDTRRKVIVGAAVLAHAEIDASFAADLQAILAKAVQRPADRKTIQDLLPGRA